MMSNVWVEILVIMLLVVANGIFAMSEIAIVSARKARLQQWANEGDAKAQIALDLANAPGSFLSVIQVGITLIGILAGAYGGVTIAEHLAAYLKQFPTLTPYRETLSLGIVVIVITYISLILGELAPKRIALNNPERIAVATAKPMKLLTAVTLPIVHLLNLSTNKVFSILRIKPSDEPPVTEEEVKILIDEGARSGVFEEMEQDMIESVFRLADRKINSIMTARPDIIALDIDDPPQTNWAKISESRHSHFPVYEASEDNIIGIASIKTLWAIFTSGQPVELRKALSKPFFVPEYLPALKLLRLLKQSGMHMALVIDEYGSIQGLVTPQDIFKSIVGDLASVLPQDQPPAIQRKDGSWLIDGMIPIDAFKELFDLEQLPGEKEGHFNTLGGFIMAHMGRIPAAADYFEWEGLRFEVVDMDNRRVDTVLVAPVEKISGAED